MKSAVNVVANEMYTAKMQNKISLTKAEERVTSAYGCRCVSVQQYSVQYKEYNLIGVTTVEASATRGTIALVY